MITIDILRKPTDKEWARCCEMYPCGEKEG